MATYEKVVVVTKQTALEELVERFNTRAQARFYLEHMGASFTDYQEAHDAYQRSLAQVRAAIPGGVRSQFIERAFLPNFTFGPDDLVVTLGPDGLVVNSAKYLSDQPLLAFNPDVRRVDGILVPFRAEQACAALHNALRGEFACKRISMAKASLNDGQTLYGFNDLFLGQRTHLSARYRLSLGGQAEDQSSSGIIVSTGAGSTGWYRSILAGAVSMVEGLLEAEDRAAIQAIREKYRFDWEADYLRYSVREPFVSKTSSAQLVLGRIESGECLEVVSAMPQNGVIFSDGIEEDYLPFNSGVIARIGVAEKRVNLIVRL